MAFEFGMFHEFQRRQSQTEAEAFAQSFAEIDAAERWGLDAIWLAEIHMAPERSVLAAPLNIASAIAARTRHIKIGTAVQVLPLCQPLRLAEEAATTDQISEGRLIFGVGRSGFPRAYEAYGISYAESRERFVEVLEVVKRAWTQETFSFDGKYYRFKNVRLVPKPYRKPHPPIRIAANNEDTFVSAGRQGYAIFVGARRGTLEEILPNLQIYRDAWKAAGHPGEGEVYLRAPVYVGDTPEEARSGPEESLMHFYRYLGARLEESATRAGISDTARRLEGGQRLQTITYDEVLRGKAIVGTPEMVADRLQGLQEELGLAGILAEMNCGGLIPQERMMRSLQLLCEKVQPLVH
jgi:alkanesulfonate monooxygenase SsuD/methylene tetrahydromethanopterin reductase-like flavin-dependent oxidoreductase (luciferase family)